MWENGFVKRLKLSARLTKRAWRTKELVSTCESLETVTVKTYDVGIPLLLSDQSIDLGLSLLLGGCRGAGESRSDGTRVGLREALDEVAEERRASGLLAVEESSGESLGARALEGLRARDGRRADGWSRGAGGRGRLGSGQLASALHFGVVDGALLLHVLRLQSVDREHGDGGGGRGW